VLSKDKDMLPYLFPGGTSQAGIEATIDNKKTLNIRELPVPLQLADWNSWLPDVHPLDIWGDAFVSSTGSSTYYQQLVDKLKTDRDGRVTSKAILKDLEDFINGAEYVMGGPGGAVPCLKIKEKQDAGTPGNGLIYKMPAGLTCEDGFDSFTRWLAVKNWEVFHTYRLEDITPTLFPYGEKRGWFPTVRSNVFQVASHRVANNSHNLRYQSRALGSYHSSAWYHTQMVLNSGHRNNRTWIPQDWFYTPMFISLNSRDNRQPMGAMITMSQIKMYQNLDMTGPDGNGVDPGADYNGWWLPFVTPWRFESALGWEGPWAWGGSISADGKTPKGFPWTHLDTYESGLRVKITNAFLKQFLRKQKSYPIANLKRQSATVTDTSYWEAADHVVTTTVTLDNEACYYNCPGQGIGEAASNYRALIRFKEMGVDATLRGELIDYMKQLFPSPQNNWDVLR
jgi:hypothetical protein